MADVSDLRSSERFLTNEIVMGSFGATEITIVNIGELGVKIVHALPLRIGATGRFWFKRGDISVSSHGRVVWSHLSKEPDAKGKLVYASGVRIDPVDPTLAAALQALLDTGVIRRDEESLERKRAALEARERGKQARPQVKILHPELDVPPEQMLLIRQIHDRLRADPKEAARWYERAKAAADLVAAESLRDRQDVLAVWEYLERSVALSTIARVLEKR